MNYIAFNPIYSEWEEFETLKEAKDYCFECFYDNGDGYHPDTESFRIFEIKNTLFPVLEITDERSNYKYDNEDDAPEGEEDQVWPYCNSFDSVSKLIWK